ncbi:hypothetical protein Anapl_16093 [Anas platyrhynchos]|uniref:Uncharacterized protein n=1 Tax=Anas platyrhynchos TaxID=8839 RepID=R0JIX7_ANAPL|nr:hypothetical protein Anapl_16093 [Anas platyrhynchos]
MEGVSGWVRGGGTDAHGKASHQERIPGAQHYLSLCSRAHPPQRDSFIPVSPGEQPRGMLRAGVSPSHSTLIILLRKPDTVPEVSCERCNPSEGLRATSQQLAEGQFCCFRSQQQQRGWRQQPQLALPSTSSPTLAHVRVDGDPAAGKTCIDHPMALQPPSTPVSIQHHPDPSRRATAPRSPHSVTRGARSSFTPAALWPQSRPALNQPQLGQLLLPEGAKTSPAGSLQAPPTLEVLDLEAGGQHHEAAGLPMPGGQRDARLWGEHRAAAGPVLLVPVLLLQQRVLLCIREALSLPPQPQVGHPWWFRCCENNSLCYPGARFCSWRGSSTHPGKLAFTNTAGIERAPETASLINRLGNHNNQPALNLRRQQPHDCHHHPGDLFLFLRTAQRSPLHTPKNCSRAQRCCPRGTAVGQEAAATLQQASRPVQHHAWMPGASGKWAEGLQGTGSVHTDLVSGFCSSKEAPRGSRPFPGAQRWRRGVENEGGCKRSGLGTDTQCLWDSLSANSTETRRAEMHGTKIPAGSFFSMCSTPWILAQEEPLRRRSPSDAQPHAEQGAGLLPVPAWCGGCPAWPPAPEHPQELPGEQQTAGPCPGVAAALTDINHRASLWDRGRWCSPPWIISHGLLMGNRWKRRCLKPELRSLLWSRCIQGGFSQASHGCACSSTEVMLEQSLCSPSATLDLGGNASSKSLQKDNGVTYQLHPEEQMEPSPSSSSRKAPRCYPAPGVSVTHEKLRILLLQKVTSSGCKIANQCKNQHSLSVPQPLNRILEKGSDEHQNDPKWKLLGYRTGSWHTHNTAHFPRCRHTEQQQEQPEGQAARSRPAITAQAPLRFRRQKQSSPVQGLKGEDTPDGIKAL